MHLFHDLLELPEDFQNVYEKVLKVVAVEGLCSVDFQFHLELEEEQYLELLVAALYSLR